jgi:DNA end-binding protein Ku
LILHTMYFMNELHGANKAAGPKNTSFAAKEMNLAKRLIDTLASPFKPEHYEDEYRKNVERLIEQKRKGRDFTPVSQPRPAPVVDILDALKRSLDNKARPAKPVPAKKSPKRSRKAA